MDASLERPAGGYRYSPLRPSFLAAVVDPPGKQASKTRERERVYCFTPDTAVILALYVWIDDPVERVMSAKLRLT